MQGSDQLYSGTAWVPADSSQSSAGRTRAEAPRRSRPGLSTLAITPAPLKVLACRALGRLLRPAVMLALLCLYLPAQAQSPTAARAPAASSAPAQESKPILRLGAGDAVSVQVYSRPELTTTTYVSEDGTITVPLAGPVKVAGLSPADAAQRVAMALKAGEFLVNPQVTITLVQFRSQQVSVLGEVRNPGRFPIESKITVFDLLAQAGGVTETGADVIFLMRPDKNGAMQRFPINMKGLMNEGGSMPVFNVEGGDSIFVPRAEQFYVYGEVRAPNMYKLEPGTTVVQAISRSGGITERGSERRIEIRRRDADGKYRSFGAELSDPVQADDVIRVKERIF